METLVQQQNINHAKYGNSHYWLTEPYHLRVQKFQRIYGMSRLSEPTIGESGHSLIGSHDIQHARPDDSTSDRRLGTMVT